MANRFQPISFTSVQDCLNYIPEHERELVVHLRKLILATIPEITEKLSYNVPYYFRNKRLCFIWPGSIPWGKVQKGVRLGFANGHLLQDEFNYLNNPVGKTVASRVFNELHEIDDEIVIQLLLEARLLDETNGQK
ncbi:DUF1801 domain-containing protein [bacterium]|nr:MAG: DUF1801 domain-containing protein [bacterium]